MVSDKNNTGKTGILIAASLAHEIRNPLALIKANLQFVELSGKKSKYKKNYEIIHREIDRINKILECYLESGSPGNVAPWRFKIRRLLDEIEQIYERPLAASGIKLSISIDDENVELNADYDKLKQVMVNVMQNARESIEQKTGETNGLIEIRAASSGLFAKITITDNGIGISETDLKMAGTPFFTSKNKGCGLGVCISKEIVERHNGSFTLTGEENKGASVTITIPSPLEDY